MINIPELEKMVEDTVEKILYSENADFLPLQKDKIKESLQRDSKLKLLKQVMNNNGYVDRYSANSAEDAGRIELKDLVTSPEFKVLFPKVITDLALETLEPALVLQNMLETIQFKGSVATIPVFSGFGGNLDIPEGGEPPVFNVKVGAFEQVVIGKSGVMVELTEETIRYSAYDIFNIHVKEALKALARWKEYKVAKMITDNASEEINGGTGKDISGADNGGLTLFDIMEAATKLINKGFNPDVIIMNPLAYPVFMYNGTLTAMFYAFGQGSLANWPALAKIANAEFYNKVAGNNISGISLPAGVFGKGLSIVLSPFMPFTPASGQTPAKTDIIVADSSALGYLVVDQLPTTDEFADPIREIRKFKIVERYSVVPKAKGAGIAKIKNVNVVKTFDPIPFYQIQP